MKPNSFDKKIASIIKEIRKRKGISQHCVSQITQVSESNFGKYDHGDIAYTIGYLKQVADCLDVHLIVILLAGEGMKIRDLLHEPLAVSLAKYICATTNDETVKQDLIITLEKVVQLFSQKKSVSKPSLLENFNETIIT